MSDSNNDNVVALPTTIHVAKTIITKSDDKKSLNDPVEKNSQEILAVHQFVTEPARARVTVPLKISKSFQSFGIEVTVEVPCYKEEIEDAVEFCFQTALTRVMKELPHMKASLSELMG